MLKCIFYLINACFNENNQSLTHLISIYKEYYIFLKLNINAVDKKVQLN